MLTKIKKEMQQNFKEIEVESWPQQHRMFECAIINLRIIVFMER